MATVHPYPAEIVVVEGLDGVGKSTVAQDLIRLTGGINVTEIVARSVTSVHQQGILKDCSWNVRYQFWLWVNHMAGECAKSVTSSGRVAIIASYVFRAVATHVILGVNIDPSPILATLTRPHRVALLTVDEDI